MAISARQKYLLNKMNSIANDVQLGTLIENAESVVASEIALAEGKLLVGNASGVAAAATLTSAQILVGNASSVATPVSVTGDVTISNAGVTAIGAAKVTKAMLAATVRPSHMVVYAGEFTTVGGDANEAISVAGVLATDLVHVTLHTKGATPRTILTAAADTDVINVEMSGDPSTDHILTYSVLRATS